MNRRIAKKRDKWRRSPRIWRPLTADSAGKALPRLIQRLKSRNEMWLVVAATHVEGIYCLLPHGTASRPRSSPRRRPPAMA